MLSIDDVHFSKFLVRVSGSVISKLDFASSKLRSFAKAFSNKAKNRKSFRNKLIEDCLIREKKIIDHFQITL